MNAHTSARPSATNRQIQVHPGISIWFVLESVVCDHPKAPPASTSRNSAKVLANVPLAVMCATRVARRATLRPPSAPSATGAAQPGFVFLLDLLEALLVQRRIRHRVPSGSWLCAQDPDYGTLEASRSRTSSSLTSSGSGGTEGRVVSADESAGRRSDAARPRPGGRLRSAVRAADRPPRPRGARLQRDRARTGCRSPRCWPSARRR